MLNTAGNDPSKMSVDMEQDAAIPVIQVTEPVKVNEKPTDAEGTENVLQMIIDQQKAKRKKFIFREGGQVMRTNIQFFQHDRCNIQIKQSNWNHSNNLTQLNRLYFKSFIFRKIGGGGNVEKMIHIVSDKPREISIQSGFHVRFLDQVFVSIIWFLWKLIDWGKGFIFKYNKNNVSVSLGYGWMS